MLRIKWDLYIASSAKELICKISLNEAVVQQVNERADINYEVLWFFVQT